MNYIFLLTKGLLIGFSTAVPIGPIGIMCIQLSIASGRRHGMASGLGAATADMLFGSVAIFGVTIISNFLLDNNDVIRVAGGIILLIIGARIIAAKRKSMEPEIRKGNVFQTYATTFFLTLTNPMTIIAYMTFLTVFNTASSGHQGVASSSLVVAGIFLGSTLWFGLLTTLAGQLKKRLTPAWLHRINRVLGIIIAAFGIVLIIRQTIF